MKRGKKRVSTLQTEGELGKVGKKRKGKKGKSLVHPTSNEKKRGGKGRNSSSLPRKGGGEP